MSLNLRDTQSWNKTKLIGGRLIAHVSVTIPDKRRYVILHKPILFECLCYNFKNTDVIDSTKQLMGYSFCEILKSCILPLLSFLNYLAVEMQWKTEDLNKKHWFPNFCGFCKSLNNLNLL